MSNLMFPCERCGQRMAVLPENQGKAVRCPHCQQVVVAPTGNLPPDHGPVNAAGPAPANDWVDAVIAAPGGVSGESIFEATEEGDGDALFASPAGPLVEMPPEPAVAFMDPAAPAAAPPPVLEIDAGLPDPALVQPPVEAAGPGYDVTATAQVMAPPPEPGLDFTAAVQPPRTTDQRPGEGTADLNFTRLVSGTEAPLPAVPLGTADGAEADGGGAFVSAPAPGVGYLRPARASSFIPTLLIFLIPYCLVSTIAVVLLYLRRPAPEPSLELLPDPRPDPKAGGPARGGNRKGRVPHDAEVPANLRVGFHQTVQVGDVEVTPQAAAWVGDDLRLTVKVVNRSRDLEFNPVSQAFLDYSRLAVRQKALMPYTFLESGKEESSRVYGGKWRTLQEGRPFKGRLSPGDEMTAQLTTDPRDRDQVQALKGFAGPLLWRVQVRRGLVLFKGEEVSTTAVVAVEFAAGDIKGRAEDE
jgi:hypothetical protein